MKKITIYSMAFLMLGIGTLNSGCMGKFSLAGKLYKWNEHATGNKFVNNGIFWLLSWWVYPICLLGDIFIFNLIEFWSGSNPLAMNEGEVETAVVCAKDGNQYRITVTRNRFEAVALTGTQKGVKTALVFNPISNTWSTEKAGVLTPFATIHPDLNKVEVYSPDGGVQLYEMSAMAIQGLNIAHQ